MTLEERLRATLARRAEHVELSDSAWDRISARTQPARRAPREGSVVALAAAVLMLVLAGVFLLRPGPGSEVPVMTDEGSSTTATTTPTTTTTTAPPTTTSTTTAVAACSAGELPPEPVPRPDLPSPVDKLRRALIAAAVSCDYEALSARATSGGGPFTFSYGDSTDPAGFWRRAEAEGERPLWHLVQVLQLSSDIVERSAPEADIHVWPSVAAKESDAGWSEVADAGLFTDAELDAMREGGSGYLGYRVGITAEGDWLFFVAGD